MYAGVGQPVPIRTIAAHNPVQGLIPVPPRVPASAPGTAYRPRAPLVRLPGQSPYTSRIQNAAAYARRQRAMRAAAVSGMRGFRDADADAFALLSDAASAGAAATDASQAAFTAAGAPVDETYALNLLLDQHAAEVGANVAAAAAAAAAGNGVPILDASGNVVMVDASTDPAAAAALAAQRAGNPVAIPAGNPLAAAAMAVTPAQAAAAAVFGQSAPNPQTAILAAAQKAAAKPAVPAWLLPAAAVVGLYFLVRP